MELTFEMTSCACPEQYDVYARGSLVGYVRLRGGYLYAECPDVGGERVYEANIGDGWTGCFTSSEERKMHLNAIEKAIKEWMDRQDDDDD